MATSNDFGSQVIGFIELRELCLVTAQVKAQDMVYQELTGEVELLTNHAYSAVVLFSPEASLHFEFVNASTLHSKQYFRAWQEQGQ